jgi:sec-independent protein translocase protein TatC
MATDLGEPRSSSETDPAHDPAHDYSPHDPAESPEHDEGGPVKSFLEHLEDLRWVLIKSLVAAGIGMLICLIAGNRVMDILERPLKRAKYNFPGTNQVVSFKMGTNQLARHSLTEDQQQRYQPILGTNRYVDLQVELVPNGTNFSVMMVPVAKSNPEDARRLMIDLVNLSPIGGFMVALQLAIYGGLLLAAPFIFYFVAGFIFPALRMNEKYYVYRGLGFGLVLFVSGVSFCYFILLPLALTASAGYSNWLGLQATQWRAEEYISFTCKFMLGMGIGFQMPVVVLTLVKIGVLNYTILSKARRYMIVINLVLGALLTTPEVLTQVMMAIPLQCLYEASVWIAWYWERRDRKRAAAGE